MLSAELLQILIGAAAALVGYWLRSRFPASPQPVQPVTPPAPGPAPAPAPAPALPGPLLDSLAEVLRLLLARLPRAVGDAPAAVAEDGSPLPPGVVLPFRVELGAPTVRVYRDPPPDTPA